MIIKIMGIFDILTAVVFFSFSFHGWFSPTVVILHAVYFGVKGAIFSVISLKDFVSMLDVIVALYMISTALSVFSSDKITVLALIWILQKGFFSLVGR